MQLPQSVPLKVHLHEFHRVSSTARGSLNDFTMWRWKVAGIMMQIAEQLKRIQFASFCSEISAEDRMIVA